MTYLLGECSYRHAEEEEEIERGSSDYPDPPPLPGPVAADPLRCARPPAPRTRIAGAYMIVFLTSLRPLVHSAPVFDHTLAASSCLAWPLVPVLFAHGVPVYPNTLAAAIRGPTLVY